MASVTTLNYITFAMSRAINIRFQSESAFNHFIGASKIKTTYDGELHCMQMHAYSGGFKTV